MLDPFAQLFQHCWGHARSLRMVYKDLWVVSFPRCTGGPNIVASCCICLHTTANTHAATPNIVGATTLGVVASVCTEPKSDAINNQTVTSRVDFHLAKRQKLSFRSFNAKISASCQWISVTHSGCYKLDKSVPSVASRIIYYIIISVACYNKTK